eukprot:COSAG04_NODE_171_length_21611_cov_4.302808_10_plen_443_part_00
MGYPWDSHRRRPFTTAAVRRVSPYRRVVSEREANGAAEPPAPAAPASREEGTRTARRLAAQLAAATIVVEGDPQRGLARQLASGFLLTLPCGQALVTAAHTLKGGGSARSRARCLRGVAGVPASPSDEPARAGDANENAINGVHFVAEPARFWRHDPILDVVIVGVRSPASPTRLRSAALSFQQLASTGCLCSARSDGSALHVIHRAGATVAISEQRSDCAVESSLCTRRDAPLLLDYAAPLAAGTSGAAVYDAFWQLVAVHVRGDATKARGRGVSIDAVRELIESNGAPLSSRVRLSPRSSTPVEPPETLRGSQAAAEGGGEDEPKLGGETDDGDEPATELPAAEERETEEASERKAVDVQSAEAAPPTPSAGESRPAQSVLSARVADAVPLAPAARRCTARRLCDHRHPHSTPAPKSDGPSSRIGVQEVRARLRSDMGVG